MRVVLRWVDAAPVDPGVANTIRKLLLLPPQDFVRKVRLGMLSNREPKESWLGYLAAIW